MRRIRKTMGGQDLAQGEKECAGSGVFVWLVVLLSRQLRGALPSSIADVMAAKAPAPIVRGQIEVIFQRQRSPHQGIIHPRVIDQPAAGVFSRGHCIRTAPVRTYTLIWLDTADEKKLDCFLI